MRRAVLILPIALLATGAAAQPEAQERLIDAKREAGEAAERAAQLEGAAGAARTSADRARLAGAAIAARIRESQADIAAAEARIALVRRAAEDQRARLARSQGPVARLLAALQSLAARPSIVAVAQPGTVDDLVHVRAVLGATLPVIRQRTAGARAELERTRALAAGSVRAAAALRDGRAKLERNRLALVKLEAEQRLRAVTLGKGALVESDRALALGEQARDIVGQMATERDAAAVESSLATLSGPLPRPGDTAPAAAGAAPYRLPVAGRIVTGFGEVSDTGVRSRGLTLSTAPGAAVVAPAGGRVLYAGRFRRYGVIVIIDHGAGWTSALTGLGTAEVRRGDRVAAGVRVGQAPAGDGAVTVELRRRGRPVEPAALIG